MSEAKTNSKLYRHMVQNQNRPRASLMGDEHSHLCATTRHCITDDLKHGRSQKISLKSLPAI